MTASSRTPHSRRGQLSLQARPHFAAKPAPAAAPQARRPRGGLPSRSQRVRRPLREQRVAAGAAEITDEAHMGQRCAHFARHGRTARARQRRCRRIAAGRSNGAYSGLAIARTVPRYPDAASRLWPNACGPRRQRHRVQRQSAADDGGARHSCRRRAREDRRLLRSGLDAGSLVARRPQPRARRHVGAVRAGSRVRAEDGAPASAGPVDVPRVQI